MVAIEYVTKWVEAHVGTTNIAKMVAQILCENIIIGFGCPLKLVVDYGTHFLNATIKQLMTKYLIKHSKKTTPYHPQINGQSEKTKGLLCGINLDKNPNGSWFLLRHKFVWCFGGISNCL